MVSIWHPEPPPWFSAFAAPTVIQPPPLPLDLTSKEVADGVFVHPEVQLSQARNLQEGANGHVIMKQRACELKKCIIDLFYESLKGCSNGDPADATKIVDSSSLFGRIDEKTAKLHSTLRGYREHQVRHYLERFENGIVSSKLCVYKTGF